MGLLDSSGQIVVAYVYDAWGRLLETSGDMQFTLGLDNPLRYRGYVYDRETGLYYLESRYYNPTTGRFINADSQFTTGSLAGMNLFSYCGNAPTIYADSTGHAAETVFDVLSVGFGIAEVWNNPSDGWAWFSLAADLLDLIPFVTCLGEGTRAFRATNAMSDVVNAADNVHDSLRIIDNSTDSLTTVYRSVSKAEALDIVKTGRFNLVFGGMESKQFGLSLSETRLFGKWTGQSIIVSAKIPTKMLDKFCDIQVDPHIFKTGTITVYESQINLFNQLVEGTITFLP